MSFIDALKVNIPFFFGDALKAVLAAILAVKISQNVQVRRSLAS
jgi:biotin transport system substrate-specific component